MSDAASEEKSPADPEAPFAEHEDAETRLPYGDGGVPFYVALAWVGFIVAYVIGVVVLILPDLRAWVGN